MKRVSLLGLAGAMAACTAGDEGHSDAPEDSGQVAPCEIEGWLYSEEPQNGGTNVFYQTDIRASVSILRSPDQDDLAWLHENLDDASLWRRLPEGDFEEVPSTNTLLDEEYDLVWEIDPDDWLLPSTDYQARFPWCDEVTTVDFRTGVAGAPVPIDPVDGAVYALALDEVEIGEGISLGQVGRDVLVQVDFPDGEPELSLAWSRPLTNEQDLCAATTPAPVWTFDNPWFEGGATMTYWDYDTDWTAIELQAAFGPDPNALYNIHMYLLNPCASAANPEWSPDTCIPCPPPLANAPIGCRSIGPFSLPVERLSTPIVPRTWAEIEADPACEE